MLNTLLLVFYGGFGELFASWERIGVFSYALPFLLIFALVFGILSKMNLFDNKGINVIIALTVSLITLQYSSVTQFFSLILPKVSVGLIILLVILILIGLFANFENKLVKGALFGISGIIILVILIQSAGTLSFSFLWWLRDHLGLILAICVVIALLWIIVSSGKPKSKKEEKGFFIKPS